MLKTITNRVLAPLQKFKDAMQKKRNQQLMMSYVLKLNAKTKI